VIVRGTLAALLGALALAAAGCGDDAAGGGRLRVVATTTVVADLARNVAGDEAEVIGILRPNADPHEYEPRPDDVRAVERAQVVLRSGLDLDAWVGDVARQSGTHAPVVDVGGGRDVHWWHDPRNAEAAVRRIERALGDADPEHRAAYARNAAAYLTRLQRLDRVIARCMAQVPAPQRKLVTDHDAFGAFARRYDIRVIGAVIPSQSTQGQASARDLARLRRTIEREHVRAIFPEESVSDRVARAVARQTGASAQYRLYGDTLGPEGSRGDSYLGMEAANADAMVRGFTGGRRGCPIAPR